MFQIVPQTFDERVHMYMKCPKKKLAEMLAETSKITNPFGCAECVTTYDCTGTSDSTSTD